MKPETLLAGLRPRLSRWAGICLFMLITAAHAVHADTLRMVASDWPPYVSSDLPRNGAVIAMITEALARDGHRTDLRIDNWPRALEGMRLGVFDLVAGAWKDAARDPFMVYSDPLIENEIVFVTLSERFIEYDELDDLQGLFIGVEKDFVYDAAFLEHGNLMRVEHRNLIQNIDGLMRGEIDIIVTDRAAFLHAVNSYLPGTRNRFRILDKPLEVRTLHLGISRKLQDHERILRDFNQRLEQMRDDGSHTAILQQYGFFRESGGSEMLRRRPGS